ncbi:MAG TPA: nucleotidyltransferase domain-containing protein [Thermoanaerobaculia bacterium]|nr:nucleotidyltransferase domain-containing protein [Thermoanaerobaculia bacterium]
MEDLERLCRRLSEDERVQAIYLFGSAAVGTQHAGSDLDLAILIGERITLRKELRLRSTVVELLRRPDVDLVILDHAPPLLRYEVVTRGRRLYARDEAIVDAFEHRSIMIYMDTEYLRRLERDIVREATR